MTTVFMWERHNGLLSPVKRCWPPIGSIDLIKEREVPDTRRDLTEEQAAMSLDELAELFPPPVEREEEPVRVAASRSRKVADSAEIKWLDDPVRGPGGHWYVYSATIDGVIGYGQTAMEASTELRKKLEGML